MRGDFIGVWSETWRGIWEKVADHDPSPTDLFCELYRELATAALRLPLSVEALAAIIDDPTTSKEAFERTAPGDLAGERPVAVFMESAYAILEDLGGDSLANHYFNVLDGFTTKFSLRYDLRRPCTLCPTVAGVFAGLMQDLRSSTGCDAALDTLMKDFESAIRDLRIDCSENRIKTCIQKQMNLLEAMGSRYPGVTQTTIGSICNQIGTWPHDSLRDAMKNLYKFTCDYPGIRHAGTATSAIRAIDMRDMVAMSIVLMGFMPYLTDQVDADVIYRGRT